MGFTDFSHVFVVFAYMCFMGLEISHSFNVLGWTDLETNRKIHKCVLVFKCLHNLVPQYLSNYFIRNYNVHGYNTRRKADLHLPKPKLSLGKRTFFWHSPF